MIKLISGNINKNRSCLLMLLVFFMRICSTLKGVCHCVLFFIPESMLELALFPSFLLFVGTPTFPNVTIAWVDVRDVVMAHVLALESPSAHGRYCLVEAVVHYSDLLKIIHELYPHLKLPEK
jgi:uncharacterized membrane protein